MITIGLLEPHEAAAFCALFRRVFGAEVTLAQRQWKYAEGPRLGAFSVVARDGDGSLVGHAGALVFPGRWRAGSRAMAQVCDVMVDPGLRGGLAPDGIYGRLMRSLQQHLQAAYPGVFAYGFAGIRPYRLGARMGLYRAVQPCRIGWLEDLGQAQAPPARRGGWRRPSWLGPAWPDEVRVATFDDPAFARLWTALRDVPGAPWVERTPAYLRWRYAQHPVHRYRAWLLRRWGRVRGWLVTRTLPDGAWLIVDGLLPASVPPLRAAQVLAMTLASQQAEPGQAEDAEIRAAPRVGGWSVETPASARLEPIMACEVTVNGWLDAGAAPSFQPGDTDVF